MFFFTVFPEKFSSANTYFISTILLVSKREENTMIILRNPQIAELIEAGCAFKSNVIISKNETKEIENK